MEHLKLHDIRNGDCTEVLKTLDSGSVDCIITDPPYLTKYKDRTGREVANDNREFQIKPVFEEAFRVLKNDSVMISFYGWNHIDLFMYVWKRVGFRPIGHIVWAKNYASRSGFLQARHEQAFLLAKGRPAKPDTPLPDVMPWTYTGNRHHPTEKSVDIFTPLVKAFTKPGDTVLDPFCGAGATGIASTKLGRRYIGIDLEPRYCDLTRWRIQETLALGRPC